MDEPITASEHYHKGLEYKNTGDLHLALCHFDQALELNYCNADIFAHKAEVLRQLRRFQEALFWVKRALGFERTSADHQTLKGRIQFDQGNWRMALSAFYQAIELDSERPWPHHFRGRAHFNMGEFAKAYDALTRAVARYEGLAVGERCEILEWQARALHALDRPADALAVVEDIHRYDPSYAGMELLAGRLHFALGDLDRAEHFLGRALLSTRDDPEVFSDAAAVLEAQGKPEGAANRLGDAIRHERDAGRRARLFLRRAAVYEALGKPMKALGDYSEAVLLSPGLAEAHMRRAGILSGQERYTEALEAVERFGDAAGRGRSYHDARSELLGEQALFLGKAGDFAGAVACFAEILRSAPDTLDFPGAVLRSAQGEGWAEQWEAALAELHAIGSPDPTVLLLSGLLAHQRGDLKGARALFKAHRRAGREVFYSLYAIGRIHHELGARGRARIYYRKSIAERGDFQEAHWELAEILEADEAENARLRECYRAILALDPESNAALERLARAYERSGDAHRALASYRALSRRDPENPHLLGNLASVCLDLAQHENAVDYFRRALTFMGGKPEFHLGLGRALLGLSLAAEAEQSLAEAARLTFDGESPLAADIAAARGRALFLLGFADKAGRMIQRHLQGYPGNPRLLLVRAMLAFNAQEYDDALAACERALIEPAAPPLRREALYIEGKVHERQGRPRRATACFEELLRGDPYHEKAVAVLSWIARNQGDMDGLARWERLASFARTMREGLTFLGWEDWAEAAKRFERAAVGFAERGDAWFHQAACLVQSGDMEGAIRAARRAARADPELKARMREHWFFEPLADDARFRALTEK